VEEGKIKGIGLCELPAEELRAAHAIHPISVIEQEYSLFARDMEVRVVSPSLRYGPSGGTASVCPF
jgi:aryl-alcohol dehydrogenase-like predicted oxidoreductase